MNNYKNNKLRYLRLKKIIDTNQLGGNYDDLKWVRGTNTSIFLSCYHESNKWKLMAKGSQFKRGFVPMSETIDPGITSFFGTNFKTISGYPPNKIKDSGVYATRAKPFDVEKIDSELRKFIEGEQKSDVKCNAIIIAYTYLRIKQYEGSNDTLIGLNIEETPCYKNIINGFIEEKEFMNSILNFLDEDLSKYQNEFKNADLGIVRKRYLEVQNDIRKKFGFSLNPCIVDPGYFGEESVKRMLGDKNQCDQFIIYLTYTHLRIDLVSRIFAVKIFADKDPRFQDIAQKIRNKCNESLERYKFVKHFFEYATNLTKPPKYTLNDLDKEIMSNPIPLLIASTNITGERISPIQEETNIHDTFEIGPQGANVLYVREEDHKNLLDLLKKLDPSIDNLDVRIDNSIFE